MIDVDGGHVGDVGQQESDKGLLIVRESLTAEGWVPGGKVMGGWPLGRVTEVGRKPEIQRTYLNDKLYHKHTDGWSKPKRVQLAITKPR